MGSMGDRMPHAPDMSLVIAGVGLRAPIILAAGTAGYVDEVKGVVDLRGVGALVTKSITREPREGNPPWRIIDGPAGMLNAIGLANVGCGGSCSRSSRAPRRWVFR